MAKARKQTPRTLENLKTRNARDLKSQELNSDQASQVKGGYSWGANQGGSMSRNAPARSDRI